MQNQEQQTGGDSNRSKSRVPAGDPVKVIRWWPGLLLLKYLSAFLHEKHVAQLFGGRGSPLPTCRFWMSVPSYHQEDVANKW